MGNLYECFKASKKKTAASSWFEQMRLVKFDLDGKSYEIYISRKRANRYSIIHCQDTTIQWEQFPVLPRNTPLRHGERRIPILSLAPAKECVRIVVIRGKPNSITGLDEGIFRSVHKYDEGYINVMSEARFKEM